MIYFKAQFLQKYNYKIFAVCVHCVCLFLKETRSPSFISTINNAAIKTNHEVRTLINSYGF